MDINTTEESMSKVLSRIAGCCFLAACMLAAPLAPAAQPAGKKIEVLWLAQSATRITTVEGKVILIDLCHA